MSGGHDGPKGEDAQKIDVSERGGKDADGNQQTLDKRLFMQLLVYDCALTTTPQEAVDGLDRALRSAGLHAVIYEDVNAPRGLGVLTYDCDPGAFVQRVRPALLKVDGLHPRQDFTMLGRSYSQGHETDLQHWLIHRPISVVENPSWNWAVWYPLRRTGGFAKLEPREQAAILREHAIIGRAYGAQDLAHDVRLACHGLDARDNEFVIGLIGKDLHPLSHVVQSMRKTRQTSEFITQMGPFFVGHVARRVSA